MPYTPPDVEKLFFGPRTPDEDDERDGTELNAIGQALDRALSRQKECKERYQKLWKLPEGSNPPQPGPRQSKMADDEADGVHEFPASRPAPSNETPVIHRAGPRKPSPNLPTKFTVPSTRGGKEPRKQYARREEAKSKNPFQTSGILFSNSPHLDPSAVANRREVMERAVKYATDNGTTYEHARMKCGLLSSIRSGIKSLFGGKPKAAVTSPQPASPFAGKGSSIVKSYTPPAPKAPTPGLPRGSKVVGGFNPPKLEAPRAGETPARPTEQPTQQPTATPQAPPTAQATPQAGKARIGFTGYTDRFGASDELAREATLVKSKPGKKGTLLLVKDREKENNPDAEWRSYYPDQIHGGFRMVNSRHGHVKVVDGVLRYCRTEATGKRIQAASGEIIRTNQKR